MNFRQMRSIRATRIAITILVIGAALWFWSSHAAAHSFRNLPREEEHQALEKIIDQRGPEAAWNFLKKEFIAPDGLLPSREDPHSLAHDVGQAFYKQLGPDGLQHCDDSFSTGCYHGFLEAIIADKGLSGATLVSNVCARMRTGDPEGCIHGTGHAFAELETGRVDKMLSDCNLFFSDKAFDCWEGGFMNTNFNRFINPKTIGTAWDLCMSVSSKYRAACAGSIPLWLDGNHMNTETIVGVCKSAQSEAMTKRCFYSLGAVVTRASKDPQKILQECAKLGADQENDCLIMGAGLSRTNQYQDWKKIGSFLCAHVTGEARERCS